MPKRIYALAKELAMDSKDLVDLCTKIGIQNKGSALASLEDDEVERIEKHLSNDSNEGAAVEAPEAPTREAPIRPDGPLSARNIGKPRSLDAPKSKPKPKAPPPEEAEEETQPEPVESATAPADQQPERPRG